MKPFLFTAGILYILFSSSCSPDTRSTNDHSVPLLEFAVDKTLLGELFRDSTLNVEFYPPARWTKTSTRTKEMTVMLIDSFNRYPVRVKEIFYDSASQSVMALSDLNEVDLDMYGKIMSEYEQVFNGGKTWDNVKIATFRFNNLIANQLLLQNQQTINFKLLFFKNLDNKFQVDYLVPRQVYPEKIRHIESSIGSIRQIKN